MRLPYGGAAVTVRHGERPLRLSAFRLRIFFSFFPFSVMPGLDPGIHAEVTLTKRFHRRS
jgi:hypothetical protein